MPRKRPATPSSAKGAPPAAELGVFADRLDAIERGNGARDAERGELRELVRQAFEQLDTCSRRADFLEGAYKLLEQRMDNLTLAVDEGIRHVDRAEKRIRATVGRARRELREIGIESPGLEAEARDLRILDGGDGSEERMQALSAPVDADPPAVAEDPLLGQLRAMRLSR